MKHRQKYHFSGYRVIRKDRANTIRGGGILALIKRGVHVTKTQLADCGSIELVDLTLREGTRIIGCYNKPSNLITNIDLESIFNINGKIILIGDLNARHTQ